MADLLSEIDGTNLIRVILGQGTGLGFGDELEAAARSGSFFGVGDSDDRYRDLLEEIQDEIRGFQDRNPEGSLVAEVAGGALLPLGLLGRAATGGRFLNPRLAKGLEDGAAIYGPNSKDFAALGAAEGILSGVGYWDSDDKTWEENRDTAFWGALLGGGAGFAAGKAVEEFYPSGVDQAIFNARNDAFNRFNRTTLDRGIRLEDVSDPRALSEMETIQGALGLDPYLNGLARINDSMDDGHLVAKLLEQDPQAGAALRSMAESGYRYAPEAERAAAWNAFDAERIDLTDAIDAELAMAVPPRNTSAPVPAPRRTNDELRAMTGAAEAEARAMDTAITRFDTLNPRGPTPNVAALEAAIGAEDTRRASRRARETSARDFSNTEGMSEADGIALHELMQRPDFRAYAINPDVTQDRIPLQMTGRDLDTILMKARAAMGRRDTWKAKADKDLLEAQEAGKPQHVIDRLTKRVMNHDMARGRMERDQQILEGIIGRTIPDYYAIERRYPQIAMALETGLFHEAPKQLLRNRTGRYGDFEVDGVFEALVEGARRNVKTRDRFSGRRLGEGSVARLPEFYEEMRDPDVLRAIGSKFGEKVELGLRQIADREPVNRRLFEYITRRSFLDGVEPNKALPVSVVEDAVEELGGLSKQLDDLHDEMSRVVDLDFAGTKTREDKLRYLLSNKTDDRWGDQVDELISTYRRALKIAVSADRDVVSDMLSRYQRDLRTTRRNAAIQRRDENAMAVIDKASDAAVEKYHKRVSGIATVFPELVIRSAIVRNEDGNLDWDFLPDL